MTLLQPSVKRQIEIERHQIHSCTHKKGKLYYRLTTGGLIDFDSVKVIPRIIHKCPVCQRKYLNDRDKAIAGRFGQCLECECEKRFPLEEQNSEALAFLLSFNHKTIWRGGRYWSYDPLFNRWEPDHWLNAVKGIA